MLVATKCAEMVYAKTALATMATGKVLIYVEAGPGRPDVFPSGYFKICGPRAVRMYFGAVRIYFRPDILKSAAFIWTVRARLARPTQKKASEMVWGSRSTPRSQDFGVLKMPPLVPQRFWDGLRWSKRRLQSTESRKESL